MIAVSDRLIGADRLEKRGDAPVQFAKFILLHGTGNVETARDRNARSRITEEIIEFDPKVFHGIFPFEMS